MDLFENFIPTQCIINNSLINAVGNLTDTSKKTLKTVKKTNNLCISCFIFSAVAAGVMFAEIKADRDETNRKISKLEAKIKELEEGE